VRRLMVAGLTIGVVLGGLFGLAVISFADRAGSGCTDQRVVGFFAHAVGGGVAGAHSGWPTRIPFQAGTPELKWQ
jgi:hypothetical protein